MNKLIALGLLAALAACSKSEPQASPEAPAAPPAAEAPAAKNAAERYAGSLQSSVEKAQSARDKANAAIQRSAPAEPAGE